MTSIPGMARHALEDEGQGLRLVETRNLDDQLHGRIAALG